MLSKLLLISSICIVAALILYFFYWNRFLGFILGLALRLLYWNQEASSCWFEIGSIHFSLLAGRILLKDVHYHSSNQTIKIVKGQIQWRYWIRRPMSEAEIKRKGEEYTHESRISSCRIHIALQGFEWFVYNRTAAYDNILSQMDAQASDRNRSSQKLNRWDSVFSRPSAPKGTSRVPATIQQAFLWFKEQLPVLDPKALLPLSIEVTKGAIVCGNPSTPSLLVAEFSTCEGTFGITEARSKHDLYKQVLTLKFRNALIRLTENERYVDPMSTLGELLNDRINQYQTSRSVFGYLSYRSFKRIWRQLTLYPLTLRYGLNRQRQRNFKATSAQTHKKRGKTVEEETPIGADFSTLEYAIERKILEAPVLELSYYVDVVGDVPAVEENYSGKVHEFGNGDVSPDWIIEFVVYGGIVRYGPWADRQRAELQRAFFPPTYQTVEQTEPVGPGDKRIWTALQIFVELRNETTLHIPFREASKDWQWDGLSEVPKKSRRREPASIGVAVGDRSSISYVMPVVAGPTGYESAMEVHLDNMTMTSSLNDIRLVTADACSIHGSLPSPLKWNNERTWTIDITLSQTILYLLRDHINMFTDLGKDWSSGPPSDWQRWVPTIYAISLNFHRYEVNFYANDQNIIDKPSAREENALLVCRGERMENSVLVPANRFRPDSTTVRFSIKAPDLAVNFSLPRWNIRTAYLKKGECNIGKVGTFNLNASYQYFSEVREEYVDHLKLDFELRDVAYLALGWTVRYWIVLRDNYLGSFTHYSTLYEYIDKRRRNIPLGDPINLKYRKDKSNMFQTTLCVMATGVAIALPAGLLGIEPSQGSPSADKKSGTAAAVVLSFSELQIHLRIHDYYLEMSLNTTPVHGHIDYGFLEALSYERTKAGQRMIAIDGIDIVANRLFGPQPRTSTYICIWEFNLGHVKMDTSIADAQILWHAFNSFKLCYTDLANAPAAEYMPPVDPDISFDRMIIKSMEVVLRANDSAIQLICTSRMKLDTNDIGGLFYGKSTSICIPYIEGKVLLNAADRNTWLEAANVSMDIYLDIYSAPKGFKEHIDKQRFFVEDQDILTGRAARLLGRQRDGSCLHKNGVYIPQPRLPSAREEREYVVQSQHRRASHARSLHHNPGFRDVSESEGEELISEADRDARLAKTRTSAPAYVPEDEQPMSSGDESDDADLTNDDSTDSDWTDLEDRVPTRDGSLLMYYAHLTRHYAANRKVENGFWEAPSFFLTRDRDRFLDRRSDAFISNTDNTVINSFVVAPDPEVNSTTIRLHFKRSFDVKLTPLLVSALAHFQHEICHTDFGPELLIDSLSVKCVSSIVSSIKSTESRTIFEGSCSAATVHLLQNISVSDEGYPNIAPHLKESHIPTKLDLTTEVGLSVGKLSFQGLFSKAGTIMEANVHVIHLQLDRLVNRRAPPLSAETPLFECSVSHLVISSRSSEVHLSWGDLSTAIGHQGPDLLLATGIALKQGVSQCLKILRDTNQHYTVTIQNAAYDILHFSESLNVVDPLSTIQPSYLVQDGIPHRLRIDAAFRFFFHLRNCLRSLPPDVHRNISTSRDSRPFSLEAFESLLHSRLSFLDQDIESTDHPLLVEILLKTSRSQLLSDPNTAPRFDGLPAVSLDLKRIYMRISDSDNAIHNEFAINGIQLHAQANMLEIIQHTFHNPASMSQTSFREKAPQTVKRLFIYLVIDDIQFKIYSHIMIFVQRLLRLRRSYLLETAASPLERTVAGGNKYQPIPKLANSMHLDVVVLLQSVRMQAAAENIVFEVGTRALKTLVTVVAVPQKTEDVSNISFVFEALYLQARSPLYKAREGNDQDILAALDASHGKITAVVRREANFKSNSKIVFSFAGLHISVPRSALRLYRFVEEWRADFLPHIESTLKDILLELRTPIQRTRSPVPSIRSSVRQFLFHINGHISQAGVSLQVMHGTWLSWEANNIIAYIQSSPSNFAPVNFAFGMQIASTILNISTKEKPQDTILKTRVKLAFPALSLGGHYNGRSIEGYVTIDFLDLKVKPSHWDTLLVVQQKFGQDFNDFITLVNDSRLKSAAKPQTPKRSVDMYYGGFIKMRGFRIGLEGFSSMLFLECQNIGGGIHSESGGTWDIGLSDLALSLASHTAGPAAEVLTREHRSAFVIIDAKVSARKRASAPSEKILQLLVTKIHAVMQPSSIGEIGDFVDHLQAEMFERKERRALELAEFKQKTRTILKTFDVKVHEAPSDTSSWLSSYFINVYIENLGVAFPITLDQDIQLPKSRGQGLPVRAFLFSISSIGFDAHRGETGEAVIRSLSFQFVSQFQQSNAAHFSGDKHRTRNRLIYPEMKAQIRSALTSNSRQLWMNANVNGFILDLDSNVTDDIFSLIDVYRRGKARLEKLSANTPRTPSSTLEGTQKIIMEKHYIAVPASNVFGSLTFLSGKVRMYSNEATRQYRSLTLSLDNTELTDEQILEIGAEIFSLPVVSVWVEYRATPASQKLTGASDEPSVLMFKNTVHSSRNVLRPTLLPFLTELVKRVEVRMRKVSSREIQSPALSHSSGITSIHEQESFKAVSSMRISFSLRIDRSKLEFTCQPDVNVIAGLHWESGGFIVNMSPGARQVSFTGTVDGLSIGLKHGFLSEDCVQLDARNLMFSVNFSKYGEDHTHLTSSLSLTLDTEFHGKVKFSRLQDVLCFKAVWLDHFPLLNSQQPGDSKLILRSAPSSSFLGPQVKRSFNTILLVRVRQIKLEVDLGQSISKISLDLTHAVLRTKLTDSLNEVAIYVGQLLIVADGNLSGRIRVPDCLFQTIQRTDTRSLRETNGRMLELRLTSGPLIASLESDRQTLLHYHAEPLEVEIYDDWSAVPLTERGNQYLCLAFVVSSPELVAAITIGAIPKLMSYANKFEANLQAQQEGASRESATFRSTRSPRPDNPLSTVTEAMLRTAKTKFKEAENRLSRVVWQHMSLRLDYLRLAAFPRSMEDAEIAQFVGRDVQARLDRLVATDITPVKRDLHLSFSSMTISKYTRTQFSTLPPPEPEGGRSWLEAFTKSATEANIVGLPSMTMHMNSEEVLEGASRTLVYDFHSNFVRKGFREFDDIYITLNVALYSWLTVLRKNMTREMDQVRATTEWRTSLSTAPLAGERRKKVENLNLESPKSATLADAVSPSPVPPRSATSPLPASEEQNDLEVVLRSASPIPFPATLEFETPASSTNTTKPVELQYKPKERSIERLTMRQLGEATPDVMHPFFMKKAGFNLEDSLPQYVHEYATVPLEEIMDVLLKLYSQQLKGSKKSDYA